MIHAINKGKISTEVKEDTKTSMLLGTLLHLPTTIFWQIILKATNAENILPHLCGEIKKVDFWPEWSAEGEYKALITNSNRVEPDVFISFENFDLIVEAKLYDGGGQGNQQWKNEIYSYRHEYGKNKKLFFLALGGNSNLQSEKECEIDIIKCSWVNLMIQIEAYKSMEGKFNKDVDASVLRIQKDLINMFEYFGIVSFWLENIDFEKYKIDF